MRGKWSITGSSPTQNDFLIVASDLKNPKLSYMMENHSSFWVLQFT